MIRACDPKPGRPNSQPAPISIAVAKQRTISSLPIGLIEFRVISG